MHFFTSLLSILDPSTSFLLRPLTLVVYTRNYIGPNARDPRYGIIIGAAA